MGSLFDAVRVRFCHYSPIDRCLDWLLSDASEPERSRLHEGDLVDLPHSDLKLISLGQAKREPLDPADDWLAVDRDSYSSGELVAPELHIMSFCIADGDMQIDIVLLRNWIGQGGRGAPCNDNDRYHQQPMASM